MPEIKIDSIDLKNEVRTKGDKRQFILKIGKG